MTMVRRRWLAVAIVGAALGATAARAQAQDEESLRKDLQELDRKRAEVLRRLEEAEKASSTAPGAAGAPSAPPPAGTVPAPAPPAPGETLLEEVEVVATGFARPRGQSTVPVSVVEGSWYEDRGVSSVADGLRQVPGAAVSRGGAPGAATSLFLRGAGSNQVLVLQDGVPLNDPTVGSQFNFFDLDAVNLDRVEVLRGSYGALYGSDAVGGVVNLVSRRGEGDAAFRSSFTGGSFRTHRETFGGSGGDAAFDWSFGVAESGTDGPHDREVFRSVSFGGLFGGRAWADGRWQVSVRSLASTAEDPYDFGNPLPPDDNIRRERDLFAVGGSLEKPVATWLTARVRASVTDIDSVFRNGADTPGGSMEFESLSQAATTEGGAALLASWPRGKGEALGGSVVLGGDWRVQESVSASDSPFGAGIDLDDAVQNGGGYLLATAEAGPVTATAGGRFDDHSQAGSEWSPQAGLRLDLDRTRSVLRANYGQGFRAPTPAEFADPFVGNPDLGAERSESVDAGLEQGIAPGVTAEAGWFRLRTRDLVVYDSATFRLENMARAQADGSEWGLRADLGGGLSVAGSWTHQRARNLATGYRLPNRPVDFGTLGVAWTRGAWTAAADLFVQGSVPDLGQTGPDMDLRRHPGRRAVVDLSLRWRASERISVFGRIENLTNGRFVETPSAPRGPPVSLFAGIAVDF